MNLTLSIFGVFVLSLKYGSVLPDNFFGDMHEHEPSIPSSHIVVYDGVCNLCLGVMEVLKKIDVNNKLTYLPFQSQTAKSILKILGMDTNQMKSILFIRSFNEYYSKSQAILRILEDLGLPFPIVIALSYIIPQRSGDLIYDIVARYRYNIFGKKEDCGCSGQDIDQTTVDSKIPLLEEDSKECLQTPLFTEKYDTS
mmetsp:Transcript_374/g.373  ORF Transcript_374/g.373 Transcript_374/m.373 type:complete len:197 (+) Transcript_374:138-728(+)